MRALLTIYGLIACRLIALLFLAISPAASLQLMAEGVSGWDVERGGRPRYAVSEPVGSNLNVDSVVLACGEIHGRRGVQLELYLSNAGPLLPKGAAIDELNKVPRAEIVIDRQRFTADILYAGDFVVLVDEYGGVAATMVSERLLDAIEHGRTMTIRFDLLDGDTAGEDGFDGELTIDLQAGAGGAAIAAVRRCGQPELWSGR